MMAILRGVRTGALAAALALIGGTAVVSADNGNRQDGKHLFEKETFGGNGRTCLTCHTRESGTISPQQAQERFRKNPFDPLFVHDGSDDGRGHGSERMRRDATVLVEIPLPPNVSLADDPNARTVVVRRGVPTTLNTPALDPVLMMDGREPNLVKQALSAIEGHAQNTRAVTDKELQRIAEFQTTDDFFSSSVMREYARKGKLPGLPEARTESEKRGKLFFEDIPLGPSGKAGTCAHCHSGPMMNQTNKFFPLGAGLRFQSIGVSEFNLGNNPIRNFIFRKPDGTNFVLPSPDPGRALITGVADSPFFDQANAFKIPSLRGIRKTGPYFHDNSAKTLEEVMAHYARYFALIPQPPIILTPQDQADIIAYMKLLE